MSIPSELQEGSLGNLAVCINTSAAMLQHLEREKTIPDILYRRLEIQALCNITIAIATIGQCFIRDLETTSILLAKDLPNNQNKPN